MLTEAAAALIDEDTAERAEAREQAVREARWADHQLSGDDDDVPTLEPAKVWHALPSIPPGEHERLMGLSGREYARCRDCCCDMPIGSQPRAFCIQLVEWRFFDPAIVRARMHPSRSAVPLVKLVHCPTHPTTHTGSPALYRSSPWYACGQLLTIMANCLTMAWSSPLDPPGTPKAAFLDACEGLFLMIFTLELLAKVLAFGLLAGTGAYLRDPWCQLDFVVVSLAWLPILFPDMGNFGVVRAVRALRPLRALKRMPGMPVLISSLLAAIPRLVHVAALVSLLFLVLGIVGVEEFKGALHYRCAHQGWNETPGHPSLLAEYSDDEYEVSLAGRRRLRTGGISLPTGPLDTGRSCDPHAQPDACALAEPGTACAYFDENMNHDALTFDSFGWSCIALLQALTFDGWPLPMCKKRARPLSRPTACLYARPCPTRANARRAQAGRRPTVTRGPCSHVRGGCFDSRSSGARTQTP